MSIVDRVKHWLSASPPPPMLTATIAGSPVKTVKPTADRDYVRLSLAQLHAPHAGAPTVQSAVRFIAGDSVVELPVILDGAKLGAVRDARLTPWMPFRGGDVTWTVTASTAGARSPVAELLRTLGGASSILTGTPFATALKVAPLVANGIDQLIGVGPKVHLATVETRDATTLVDGWVALIQASAKDVQAKHLSVVDGKLHLAGAPYAASDFLLLRVEVTDRRDDWATLDSIAYPYDQAVAAAGLGHRELAYKYLDTATTMAWGAPELTRDHKKVVRTEMRKAVDGVLADDGPSGLAPAPARDLDALFAGIDLDAALANAPETLEEALGLSPS